MAHVVARVVCEETGRTVNVYALTAIGLHFAKRKFRSLPKKKRKVKRG